MKKLGVSGSAAIAALLCVVAVSTGWSAEAAINTLGNDQRAAAVAFSSWRGEHLVVWEHHHSSLDNDIRGQWVTAEGVLSGDVLTIEISGDYTAHPSVAYNSTSNEFLVVYERRYAEGDHDIYGVRLHGNGIVLGTAFAISTLSNDESNPAVAYNASQDRYLVVWERREGSDEFYHHDIFGREVDGSGALPGEAFEIRGGDLDKSSPALAYEDLYHHFLVVWQEKGTSGDYSYDICGRLVGSLGMLVGGVMDICTWGYDQVKPRVAYNAKRWEYLVVWEDHHWGWGEDWDIYGRRMGAPGVLLGDCFGISFEGPNARLNPDVAYKAMADEYVVAWEYAFGDTDHDVYCRRVGGDGTLLGSGEQGVSTSGFWEGMPAAVSDGGERHLLVWEDGRNGSTTGIDLYGTTVFIPYFQGRVFSGLVGNETTPLSNVQVKLYCSNNSGDLGTHIKSATTDGQGWYGLAAESACEYYHIVETDPVNYVSVGATTAGGAVVNSDWIRYLYPLEGKTLTGNKFWDTPQTVMVPDVVGMDQESAQSAVASVGLVIGHVGHAYNDMVPENNVISQDPVEGVPVLPGTSVNLIISLGQPDPGSFVHEVNPDLPRSVPSLPVQQGEPPRIVAALLAPDGTREDFVVDEVILYAPDPQILSDFIQSYNAVVLWGGALPDPPDSVPPDAVRHEYAQTDYYLLRVQLSRADLSDLPLWMEEMGLRGDFTFSSEDALRLGAILAKSTVVNGLEVAPNLVGHIPSADCVLTHTDEYDDGPPEPPKANAFGFSHLNDNKLQVTRAWQYLDLLDLSRPKVNLAIVDSGFSFNQDFPPKQSVPQYDFVNKTYNVDGQQNPYPCGGSGPGCTYHGSEAYSVAAAIIDNEFGSAGTSGGVAFPYLLRHDHTFKGVMWAVGTAVYWGADVINANWEGNCGWWCRNFGSEYSYAKKILSGVENADVFLTVPSGNYGYNLDDHDLMPCEMWGTTCVGGIDLATKEVVEQSNYGSWVEIYAPFNGVIATPVPGVTTPYAWFGGTCAASPYVAGVGALMKYVDPNISLNDLRNILIFDTASTKNDPRIGAILYVNAFEAVKETAYQAGLIPKEDSYEPNDTETAAETITPGTHTATVALGDLDFYTFETTDYMNLQLTVTYKERINPLNKVYTRLDSDWGTDVGGTHDLSRSPLPPGKHILEIWAGAEAMNCYTITLGLTTSSIAPDAFDDQKPAGEPRNDQFSHAAVVPDVVEPFGLLSSVGIYDLNHDIASDIDFFSVQIDAAQGPYDEPECCDTVDEYTSQGRFQIMVLPGPSVVRPFEIKVYGSDGILFETKSGLDYVLECPHDHFLDGQITFSVRDNAGRNFYELALLYNRCDRRILPHWTLDYDVPPFFRVIPEFVGHAPWIFPGDPILRDRYFAGEPLGDLPPEYLIFDRDGSGAYILDVGFPVGGDVDVRLFNEEGELLATAQWLQGRLVKRLEVGALHPGTYYIRMEGGNFGTPCVLSSMTADPEVMAGEFGRVECGGDCWADYDHDEDVDGLDLAHLARTVAPF